MVASRGQGFSSQRVLVVAVLVATVGSLVVQGETWGVYDCPGIVGNRHIYDKVARVCDDCYNIFRNTEVSVKCRRDCFFNADFLNCLRATERHEELSDFRRWISILSSGRK